MQAQRGWLTRGLGWIGRVGNAYRTKGLAPRARDESARQQEEIVMGMRKYRLLGGLERGEELVDMPRTSKHGAGDESARRRTYGMKTPN